MTTTNIRSFEEMTASVTPGLLADLNTITVTGRLGRDPELKQSAKGSPYLRFSLANNRLSDFGVQEVSWFNVTVWGEDMALAIATRIHKGDHVTVIGRIDTSRDEERGINYLNIVAEDVHKSTTSASARSNLNGVAIAGRLGRAAEFKRVGKAKDRPMLSFSLANSRTDEYSFTERTSWVNVVAWAEVAEELSHLKLEKGMHVLVSGYLAARTVGEGEERKTYYQVVVEKLGVNDRQSAKRRSGAGNGAEKFEHPSQRTVADRFTNSMDTTPDFGDELHQEEERRERQVVRVKAKAKKAGGGSRP